MTVVLVVILVIVIVTAVALYRRGWLSRLSEPSASEADAVLKAIHHADADPEDAKPLLKPQLDRATAEWKALRERAETDPVAAARVHEIIKGAIESTQRAVREPRGDPAVRARLHQELATLWDDLAWANSRLRQTAGTRPPPKK
jgi:hypothetical protein